MPGPFSDAGAVSAFAIDAVQWGVAEGLINGETDELVVPGGASSRAVLATLLMRFCENILA